MSEPEMVVQLSEQLYKALISPNGLRRRIIKLIFPEICSVADMLRAYYWKDPCPNCGSINTESGTIEQSVYGYRWCRACRKHYHPAKEQKLS